MNEPAQQASDSGRVAIITGASRGFGLALARELAGGGWRLVVDARHGPSLDAAAALMGDAGTVLAIAGDVSDPDHRQELVDAARRLGGLQLLVNNASTLGASPQPALGDLSDRVVRHIFDVNVFAPLALVREALPLLRRGGMVVNVTSDAATGGYPGWGGYGSSKAALDAISDVLAAEEPDIRVVRFDPGDMNTQMHQEAFPGEDISDRPPPEASAPALVHLIRMHAASGAYAASDVEVP
jgi:NAD(P)-dependent dehydrogenase (short-subunit alcohol dehydrogenase family)